MFELQQILDAHSKVKSGADFPNYIKEIKALGVTHYELYVSDGHVDYHNGKDFKVTVSSKYDLLTIAENPDLAFFKTELRAHQEGKTDYPTFVSMCANAGVEKWMIDIKQMTCSYYDSKGNLLLTEFIPE
ncbi:DUF1398 domain-containing protein [Flavobacterium sp.]|uniref:DUF1398 domain-containing protein n=1 Tax=Flavobacterium sp. TaxID=239 RepID=UPI002FDAA93B